MRSADVAGIEHALGLVEGTSARARYQMHQLELWRDRLLQDDAALTQYLQEHPTTDRQSLRRHINKARTAEGEKNQRAASRALFRFLRDSENHSD